MAAVLQIHTSSILHYVYKLAFFILTTKIVLGSFLLVFRLMDEDLPPGFRFHPTDEELITCYLTRKVSDFSFVPKAIAVVDLNKCEPWDLPAKASMGEKEWYFFSLRDRKYPTGLRTNRATEAGYWKTTGKDKEITREDQLVGMKKTLVFYSGRAPKGEKSNWVMHEYRLETKNPFKTNKEQWVVCRIFKKSSAVKKPQSNLSYVRSTDSLNDMIDVAENEYKDIELPNLNAFTSASSGFNNNNAISVQDYNAEKNLNLNMMGMNNWAASNTSSCVPLFPWTSSLLNSNLSMNSLLLKALQLRTYQQQREVPSSSNDYYPFSQQGGIGQNGTDHFSSNLTALSSKTNLEPMQRLQPQEQPFNDIDSINW